MPTPIALRQVHFLWFRFGHTQVWVEAPLVARIFRRGVAPQTSCPKAKTKRNSAQRKCSVTRTFSGVRKREDKIRIGYLILAFSGAHNWTQLLRNPCPLGSRTKGTKSKVATSPLAAQWPTSGRNCYVTPAFSGVPGKGDKIKSGCIGIKVEIVDMQPKRKSPKKFHTNGVLASKITIKNPPRTISKGGGSETPHGITFPCLAQPKS